MKLATQAVFLWVFAIAIMLFWHTATVDPASGNLNMTTSNSTNVNLLEVFTNPQAILSTDFWDMLLIFIGGMGLIGMAALFFRFTVTDAVAFTPMFLMYLAFAAFPIGLILSFLRGELASYACGGAANCLISTVIAGLIAGSLAFNWVTSCFKFWRTGFTE